MVLLLFHALWAGSVVFCAAGLRGCDMRFIFLVFFLCFVNPLSVFGNYQTRCYDSSLTRVSCFCDTNLTIPKKCNSIHPSTSANGVTIYHGCSCATNSTGSFTPNCPNCDDDRDGLPNKCEPSNSYLYQADFDPDLCSSLDGDHDGVPNDNDPDYTPLAYDPLSPTQDFDNDGTPNDVDNDDDGDGWPDVTDPHPAGFDDDDGDGVPDFGDPDYTGIRYDGTGSTGSVDGSVSHHGGGTGFDSGIPANSGGSSGSNNVNDLCLHSPSCDCIPSYARYLGLATFDGNQCCDHYGGTFTDNNPESPYLGHTFSCDLHCNCVPGACGSQAPGSDSADYLVNSQLVDKIYKSLGKNLSGSELSDQLSNLRQGLKYDQSQFFNLNLSNEKSARNFMNNESNDRHNKLIDHISDATNITNRNDNVRHSQLLEKINGTNSKLDTLNSKFGVGAAVDDNPSALQRVSGSGSVESVIDGFTNSFKNSPVTEFLKNSGITATNPNPVLVINNPMTEAPVSIDFSQWSGSFSIFGNLLLACTSLSMGLYIFRG